MKRMYITKPDVQVMSKDEPEPGANVNCPYLAGLSYLDSRLTFSGWKEGNKYVVVVECDEKTHALLEKDKDMERVDDKVKTEKDSKIETAVEHFFKSKTYAKISKEGLNG